MSELAVVLFAASAVLIAALVLRRRRLHGASFATMLVGLFLAIAGVAGGLILLPVDDAPSNPLEAVGFVPPAPARPGRGFAVSVAVKVTGCSNPVDVSVVAAGTADYWLDHRPSPRKNPVWSSFWLILPGVGLRDLRIGLADSATDLTTPTQTAVSSAYAQYVHTSPPVRKEGRTVVSGQVAYWQQTLLPIAATFRAQWLVHRGLSSCYLKLPVLSGALTVLSAEAALGPQQLREYGAENRANRTVVQAGNVKGPYDPALEVTHGTSMVSVKGGEVTPDASLPTPASLVNGDPAWTCQSLAESTGSLTGARRGQLPDVVVGTRGAGYSEGVIERSAAGNCRAVAAIAEDSAAYTRDLVLLGVGAVTSLGITLVVQDFLDWLKGDGAEQPPKSSDDRGHEAGRRRRRRRAEDSSVSGPAGAEEDREDRGKGSG